MRRQRERESTEPISAVHLCDDVLCLVILTLLDWQLSHFTKGDFNALTRVSRHYRRVMQQQVAPELTSTTLLTDMPHDLRTSLVGLRWLDLRREFYRNWAVYQCDLMCFTRLETLQNLPITGDYASPLPSSLRLLSVRLGVDVQAWTLPANLGALTSLIVHSDSDLPPVRLHGLERLTTLESLALVGCDVSSHNLLPLTRLCGLYYNPCRASPEAHYLAVAHQLTTLSPLHSGEVPTDETLVKFTALRVLDLCSNPRITGSTIHALPHLHTLVLRNNHSVRPQYLATLTRLTELDLSYASGALTHSGVLAGLHSLRVLHLTMPHGLTARWLASMTALTTLQVDRPHSVPSEACAILEARGGGVYAH